MKMESKILTTLNDAVQEGVKAIKSIKHGNTNMQNLKIIGKAEFAEELIEKISGKKITLLQDTRDLY
tara:strand:- start:74 stop:274 length:201 start_codon:yes stop_codon:yes gene_type:complete